MQAFFSGSGQRLIFSILFFYFLHFSFGVSSRGFLLYSPRFLWGLFDLTLGLGLRLVGLLVFFVFSNSFFSFRRV